MPDVMTRDQLWTAIHTERAALLTDLEGLTDAQWRTPSLCAEWTVEEVVAHLTAAAVTRPLRWIASIVAARFDPAVHNRRRLAEQLGATPAETCARFRAAAGRSTGASGHTAAWLGEVVVHAEDVRRPLGLTHVPPVDVATEVARFFASRDFAVNSSTLVRGLRLEATDGPFASGAGDLVRGSTFALVLALAGRPAVLGELSGPGVAVLRERIG